MKLVALFSVLLLIRASDAAPLKESGKSRRIQETLAEAVTREKIPGMVAAITSSRGVLAVGAAGIRKIGTAVKLTENDLMHLGSCTKAMTSALLATLVSEGMLTWETSLIEALPELKGVIHRDYYPVTVWELLAHRARLAPNAENWWAHRKMELKKRRLEILKENLKEAPSYGKGVYHYSNLGYMIAGCIAEKVTGSTWEVLMRQRIFGPLGMSSAGFGPPGTPGNTDQPWGHMRAGATWQPRQFDNAEALGPAGRVNCTAADWAKFLAMQLPDGRKLGLNQEALERLITPTETYAGGWILAKRTWGKGTVLTHSGSNTMWHASVWVAPKLDRSFLVATNSSDENSHRVCDHMIGELIRINQGN